MSEYFYDDLDMELDGLFDLIEDPLIDCLLYTSGSKKEKTKGVASIRINGLKAGERTVSIEVCKGEIVLVSREAAPIDCFWDQCQRSSDSGLEFIIDGKKVASHTMADLVKNRVGMISCETVSYTHLDVYKRQRL